MEDLKDIWLQLILPYANFAIFLALAIYFFKKPARAAAQKQADEFARLMDEATKARDLAQAKLKEISAREAKLEQEISDIVSVSKVSAESEAAKIVQDAERIAKHLKDEAARIAHAEVEAARKSLRQEIIEAVRSGVTQRARQELNHDAQLRIVHKQIGELANLKAEG